MLVSEVAARNVESKEPIFIRYEYRYLFSMVLIDTPGLKLPGDPDEEKADEIVNEYAKVQERILLFVEESQEWENTRMFKLAEKLDPKWRRSIFVYTKFNYMLQSFNSLKDLNTFLSARPPPKVKSFFLSGFSKATHDASHDPNLFLQRAEQAVKRDFDLLAKLKYDHKYIIHCIC